MTDQQRQFLHHLAIIMDGNGRWAKQLGHTRSFGHEKGADVAKKIIKHCVSLGIKELTLFAFGDDNWLRPPKEVNFLMSLMSKHIRINESLFYDHNIRFRMIGDRDKLNKTLLHEIELLEEKTKSHSNALLNLAFSYSGRFDIVQATRKIVQEHTAGDVEYIDDECVYRHLQSYNQENPNYPDLLIRTGGVNRISNFMLWDLAYTEILFHPGMWPDFTEKDLDIIVNDYANTQRRFGKTPEQTVG